MKKTIKYMLLLLIAIATMSFTGKETKTITIKSSTVCDMCKERIERELVFEKGIKNVKVDISANTITVKYRTDKTDEQAIKQAISKLGYWADEVAADKDAFDKLPECCKKEGCGKKTE